MKLTRKTIIKETMTRVREKINFNENSTATYVKNQRGERNSLWKREKKKSLERG